MPTPLPTDTSVGDGIGELCLFAGKGVGAIRDLPGAGELVARLWQECLDA